MIMQFHFWYFLEEKTTNLKRYMNPYVHCMCVCVCVCVCVYTVVADSLRPRGL